MPCTRKADFWKPHIVIRIRNVAADGTATELPREGWQTFKFNSSKLKSIRKMKLYVEGAREAFYPIVGIDKLSYQVQPVATPDQDDDQE